MLSIKIKIADRKYPMKAAPEDEEKLRIAGKLINEKLKEFNQSFGIDDRQDLLAMVAFDVMVERLKLENANSKDENELAAKIKEIDALLDRSF